MNPETWFSFVEEDEEPSYYSSFSNMEGLWHSIRALSDKKFSLPNNYTASLKRPNKFPLSEDDIVQMEKAEHHIWQNKGSRYPFEEFPRDQTRALDNYEVLFPAQILEAYRGDIFYDRETFKEGYITIDQQATFEVSIFVGDILCMVRCNLICKYEGDFILKNHFRESQLGRTLSPNQNEQRNRMVTEGKLLRIAHWILLGRPLSGAQLLPMTIARAPKQAFPGSNQNISRRNSTTEISTSASTTRASGGDSSEKKTSLTTDSSAEATVTLVKPTLVSPVGVIPPNATPATTESVAGLTEVLKRVRSRSPHRLSESPAKKSHGTTKENPFGGLLPESSLPSSALRGGLNNSFSSSSGKRSLTLDEKINKITSMKIEESFKASMIRDLLESVEVSD